MLARAFVSRSYLIILIFTKEERSWEYSHSGYSFSWLGVSIHKDWTVCFVYANNSRRIPYK